MALTHDAIIPHTRETILIEDLRKTYKKEVVWFIVKEGRFPIIVIVFYNKTSCPLTINLLYPSIMV